MKMPKKMTDLPMRTDFSTYLSSLKIGESDVIQSDCGFENRLRVAIFRKKRQGLQFTTSVDRRAGTITVTRLR